MFHVKQISAPLAPRVTARRWECGGVRPDFWLVTCPNDTCRTSFDAGDLTPVHHTLRTCKCGQLLLVVLPAEPTS